MKQYADGIIETNMIMVTSCYKSVFGKNNILNPMFTKTLYVKTFIIYESQISFYYQLYY